MQQRLVLVVMAYIVTAYIVMPYVFMACILVAYIVMAHGKCSEAWFSKAVRLICGGPKIDLGFGLIHAYTGHYYIGHNYIGPQIDSGFGLIGDFLGALSIWSTGSNPAENAAPPKKMTDQILKPEAFTDC